MYKLMHEVLAYGKLRATVECVCLALGRTLDLQQAYSPTHTHAHAKAHARTHIHTHTY